MNVERLGSIQVEVVVELGRTFISVAKFAEMNEGTVVKLDKLAGTSIDFRVSGQLVARGDAVVIDNYFGIKLTEIFDERTF